MRVGSQLPEVVLKVLSPFTCTGSRLICRLSWRLLVATICMLSKTAPSPTGLPFVVLKLALGETLLLLAFTRLRISARSVTGEHWRQTTKSWQNGFACF